MGGWRAVMSSLCRLRSRKLRCLDGDPNIRGGDIELARYDKLRFLPELVLTGAFEPSPSDSELDDPIKPARRSRGGDDGACAKNDVLDADRPCRGLCPAVPPRSDDSARPTVDVPDDAPEGFPRTPAAPPGRIVLGPCVTLDALCTGTRVPFVPSFAPFEPSPNPRNESPEDETFKSDSPPGGPSSRESLVSPPPPGIEPGTAERHGSRSPARASPFEVTHTGSIAGNPARGGLGGCGCRCDDDSTEA